MTIKESKGSRDRYRSKSIVHPSCPLYKTLTCTDKIHTTKA